MSDSYLVLLIYDIFVLNLAFEQSQLEEYYY